MRIAITALLPLAIACNVLEIEEPGETTPQPLQCAESTDERSCIDGGCVWHGDRCEQPPACSDMQRDDCIASSECILEQSDDGAYVCRAAANGCEQIPGREIDQCNDTVGCEHAPEACYCPEGLACFCGGGPPPRCLEAEVADCTPGEANACPNSEVCCPHSTTDGTCVDDADSCAERFEHLCLGFVGAPCPDGFACIWIAGDMGVCVAGDLDCASMQRDVCISTSECILEQADDLSYVCRDAANDCERIPGSESAACSDAGCEHVPMGGCYCPEDSLCYCEGGPPPMCIERETTDNCAVMQRDDCIASSQCVLELDIDGSYLCRAAVGDCESIPGNMHDACREAGCILDPDFCYCPEDVVCTCGGGPPPICRDKCGGFAGWECDDGYFCDLPMWEEGWPGSGYQECRGNYDQPGMCMPIPDGCDGAPSSPVCGCVAETVPTTYDNDCERRRAGSAFSHHNACE